MEIKSSLGSVDSKNSGVTVIFDEEDFPKKELIAAAFPHLHIPQSYAGSSSNPYLLDAFIKTIRVGETKILYTNEIYIGVTWEAFTMAHAYSYRFGAGKLFTYHDTDFFAASSVSEDSFNDYEYACFFASVNHDQILARREGQPKPEHREPRLDAEHEKAVSNLIGKKQRLPTLEEVRAYKFALDLPYLLGRSLFGTALKALDLSEALAERFTYVELREICTLFPVLKGSSVHLIEAILETKSMDEVRKLQADIPDSVFAELMA